MKLIVAALMLGMLEGCCGATVKPVAFQDGMAALNKTMQSANAIQLSYFDVDVHAAGELDNVFTPLAQGIAAVQCKYGVSNPIIPVVTGPINLAIQVSTAVAGTAQVSFAGVVPGGQAGSTYTRTDQQALTFPVTFVSAINLPDFYLGQVLPYFANLGGLPGASAAGLSDGQKRVEKILLHELQTRDLIRAVVTKQITAYSTGATDCAKVSSIKASFVAPATIY